MRVYLAGANNSLLCGALDNMPAVISYGIYTPIIDAYQATFSRILIDSGAFSAYNSGKEIDVLEYAEWAERWDGHADAVAGLDDISGDWRSSMANYEAFPGGFPTFHYDDPPELLDDLVPMARERGGWIGLGLPLPRQGREDWVRRSCERIPDDIHVHGWAMRLYAHVRRLDSVDSTNWLQDVQKVHKACPWLTRQECLEIMVKKFQRAKRVVRDAEPGLFG